MAQVYNLYGFDLSLDLVYDFMHILPLFIFKKYIANLKDGCHGKGLKLEATLKEVTKNKPLDFKGQWPSHIIDCLGYWKAKKINISLFLRTLCP
jgi:hypothetical protein